MAKKPAEKKPESNGSRPKSNRGGKRPGAGAKPKAVKELRDGLIAGLIAEPAANQTPPPATQPATPEAAEPDLAPVRLTAKTAAERAIELFREVMDDEGRSLDLRMKAARELLDRVIGKPRQAEAPKSDDEDDNRIVIYIPDNGRDAAAEAS